MQRLKYIGCLTLLFFLPLSANEPPLIPTTEEKHNIPKNIELKKDISSPKPNIKELIHKVQNAPDAQKRVLMNQLKLALKKMNKETRQDAMKALKKSFSKHNMEKNKTPKQLNHQKTTLHPLNHQPKFRHLEQGLIKNKTPKINQGLGTGHK